MCSEARPVPVRPGRGHPRARTLVAFLLALALGAALLPAAAMALTLDEAKAQGLVGERPDGYLGAVQANPSAEVKALVDQVNARRTEVYAKIAKEEGISVVVVAARSGERLIQEARPGEYVLMGTWKKK
jgi:uncharacterized protein YdbL (DUF1318 family)